MTDAHPDTSLNRLFSPRSIAVAGASNREGSIGHRTMAFLESFSGPVCTIGPGMDHETLAEVPFAIDLLVVNLPAAEVETVATQAAAAGVGAILVYSGGFADAGAAGREVQDRLAGICRAAGIRLLGPNSAGVVNVHSGLFATYSHSIAHARPKPGAIAFVTQSGAVGTFALCRGVEAGLGFSHFLATGNEADVNVADCIDWLAGCTETRVILLYLEAVDDGARLVAAIAKARRAGKPVIVLKGGASETGAAAAQTHTGKLAGEDAVYSAAFAAAGACRVASIEEMLDVARFCAVARLPRSADVTVLSGSGGIGVMMADAAAACGLSLPPLDPAARARISRLIPEAGTLNPVDTTGQILNDFGLMTAVLDEVAAHHPDRSMVIFLATVGVDARLSRLLLEALAKLRADHPQGLIAMCMIADDAVTARLAALGIPVFDDPTRLIRALARAAELARLAPPVDSADPGDTMAAPPLPAAPWSEQAAREVLESVGLPFPPGGVARTAQEAAGIAARLGGTLAMKVISPQLPHKTDAGGVALDVAPEAAAATHDALRARVLAHAPGIGIEGIGVHAMVRGGVETVIGTRIDPVFGPIVLFGLGGIHVEVFGDVAVRLAPVSRSEALGMIDSLRGAGLFDAQRGRPAVDRDAIADALVTVSRLAAAHRDRIESLEINPFLARERGGMALDALMVPMPGCLQGAGPG